MEKVYNSSSSSGIANFGWLNANYSFSITNYTNHIQFRLLRVLNEDVIGQGKGFVPHPQIYLHFRNIDDEISTTYT